MRAHHLYVEGPRDTDWFFVTWAHMAEHPELVRAQTAAGHEVGLHTFTHTDLATTPVWRTRLELPQ